MIKEMVFLLIEKRLTGRFPYQKNAIKWTINGVLTLSPLREEWLEQRIGDYQYAE